MDRKSGVMLALSAAVISGFAVFINKYSVSQIDSDVFTFLKNVVAAVFLLCLILFARNFKALKELSARQWLQLVAIGLVGGSIPFILFFKGLSLTSAASGSLIHKSLFIFATFFAVILLKEKINKWLFLGAVLILAGNFLILKLTPFSFGLGELLVLIAAVLWGFENVLSKYTLNGLPASIVAFGRMFFGSVFIFIYLAVVQKIPLVAGLSSGDMLWTILTSVILFCFLITYYSGLKYINVSSATAILLAGAPITALLNFATSDVHVALIQLFGIILAGLGIALAVFSEFRPSPLRIHSES
ncbi:MAG TPA: DMT family transporter [Candidatus Nanoarchaeia archaeon]|nr:DMT family transporter [Candidatus Nanoarchaeia archaeon]